MAFDAFMDALEERAIAWNAESWRGGSQLRAIRESIAEVKNLYKAR